ncbi:MAG: NAD(P)-dependent alcohol dehydrogenase [Gammaproteobacteria bacterium]|nr:NAD(P)-dependent alcohol dehydrogenase [Gammaproteobacteria bacterium]
MKSVVLKEGFGIDKLTLTHAPSPKLASGMILVKMKAVSLNYVDLLLVKGQLNPTIRPPFIPVSDGAGIVEEVGSDIKDFKPGDHVATTYIPQWIDGRYTAQNSRFETRPGSGTTPGQLVEYKLFRTNELIKVPEFLNFAESCTLPIAALTAWNALAYGKAKAGDTILLHGTGGVSIFALQFAKALGARVIITSSDDNKLTKARELGADCLINYKQTPEWISDVLTMTDSEGADVVVETVGGSNLNKSLEALRLDGHISVVGFLDGVQSPINLIALNLKRAKVNGLSVGSRQDFADMLKAISVNKLKPVIDKIFPLDQTAEAFSYLESARHFGKIVIEF